MNKTKVLLVTGACLLAGCEATVDSVERPSAKMFPEIEGQKRHVFYVDPVSNEQDKRVEIIAGKQMLVDCNQVMLSGQVVEHNLKGWGYRYYQVEGYTGRGGQTLMACPENSEQEKFIKLNSKDLYRYNSKLPIVVYAPEELEVSFRIWSAES
ncbi:ecotin [Photobacterium sanctipauli]|uniref:Ecotin n=1 Tax=Photobacterium sanctipauli TaxID=1342794 RepID=A0A2T3NPA6_9GAMM|nr:ecotin family protein [Photobacterium sanctipauli]PSW18099.1 ecotin [Photobacterium sanctipauli]